MSRRPPVHAGRGRVVNVARSVWLGDWRDLAWDWKGRGRTGESRTEPTELMFVRRRKSSPIFFMISLWLMSILPVSLMISGMSFVSSIVVDIKFSNCREAGTSIGRGRSGGRKNISMTDQGYLHRLRKRVRERELGPARKNGKSRFARETPEYEHVTRAFS